jgi:hypothetical protein
VQQRGSRWQLLYGHHATTAAPAQLQRLLHQQQINPSFNCLLVLLLLVEVEAVVVAMVVA